MQILTFIKIAHLMGLIMGLGGAVLLDLTLLTRGIIRPVGSFAMEQLRILSRAVSIGLAILWVTGAALIWLNLQVKPEYLSNPKLWAKIIVVVILTLNGMVIHRYIMPEMKNRLGFRLFDGASNRKITVFTAIASISVVSWFTPFVLGKASELNFVTPMSLILLAYGCAVLFVWGTMLALMSGIAAIQEQSRQEYQEADPQIDLINHKARIALEKLSSRGPVHAQAAE